MKVSYTDRSKDIGGLLDELKQADLFAMHAVFKTGTLYTSWPSHLCFCFRLHEVSCISLSSKPEEALHTILQFKELFEDESKTLISSDTKNGSKEPAFWSGTTSSTLKSLITSCTPICRTI